MDMQEAFRRIRELTGTSVTVRVSKRNDEGKWAFITGSMKFNPDKEDPEAIEERVQRLYGPGDYCINYIPPRGSGAKLISYELSIAGPSRGGIQENLSTPGTDQYSRGILTDLAQALDIINTPQNRASAENRQVIETLSSALKDMSRKQNSERYERHAEEPPSYEYPPEDPEMRAMKDSLSRMERLMDKFLEAQMTPRKDDGGMKEAIKAIGDMMTPILTPLMTAMTAPRAAPAQGTSVSDVLQVITALNKGKEESPKEPNSKLLDTVLTIVGTQGRDQLDMLLRGFDMGKKGEMSADALADLREDKEPAGITDKLLGLGEKFAEALGSSVGAKIGDAAANFATTGSPVPAAPAMGGIPVIRAPGARMPAPIDDQSLVRRTPPPPPPRPAPEPGLQAPRATPPVRPAVHGPGDARPAQFPRPGTGHPPPQAAPMGVPPELSQGFINALSSDEPPASIAAKTMMMINTIANNPEAAPGMGAFLDSFKLPLDEGLARLKPLLVPSHFEKLVSMKPKVEKTYAEIQKLVGTAGTA